MKHNVKITVVQTNKEGTDDEGFTLMGRLLGACNTIDATKIAQNWPVAERVLTSSTKELKNVALALNEAEKDQPDTKTMGHVVAAVTAMGPMEAKKLVNSLTKQLFISPPITVFSEDPAKKNQPFMITLEGADGSIITVEDCPNE